MIEDDYIEDKEDYFEENIFGKDTMFDGDKKKGMADKGVEGEAPLDAGPDKSQTPKRPKLPGSKTDLGAGGGARGRLPTGRPKASPPVNQGQFNHGKPRNQDKRPDITKISDRLNDIARQNLPGRNGKNRPGNQPNQNWNGNQPPGRTWNQPGQNGYPPNQNAPLQPGNRPSQNGNLPNWNAPLQPGNRPGQNGNPPNRNAPIQPENPPNQNWNVPNRNANQPGLNRDGPSEPVDQGGAPVDPVYRPPDSELYMVSRTPVGRPLSARKTQRQEAVVRAFKHAWKAYVEYAWGKDEVNPVSHTSTSNGFNMGLTLVDSLDTMWLMGLEPEFNKARDWVAHSLNFDAPRTVSVFETTIRVLGGLLSAYHLSGERVFLEKAVRKIMLTFLAEVTVEPPNRGHIGITRLLSLVGEHKPSHSAAQPP